MMAGLFHFSLKGARQISIFGEHVQQRLFAAPLKRSALIFILTLFGVDVLLIGSNAFLLALKFFGFVESGSFSNFSVSHEGSIPEMFNSLKLCLVTLVLMRIYGRARVPIYLILALIFVFALLDEALDLHERLSVGLVEFSVLPDFWKQTDNAQVLFFMVIAALFAPLMLLGWVNANSTHRQLSTIIVAMLFALAFFAVFVDFLHSFVSGYSRVADSILWLVEDGGEMLIVTISCWVALSIDRYVCLTHHPLD